MKKRIKMYTMMDETNEKMNGERADKATFNWLSDFEMPVSELWGVIDRLDTVFHQTSLWAIRYGKLDDVYSRAEFYIGMEVFSSLIGVLKEVRDKRIEALGNRDS